MPLAYWCILMAGLLPYAVVPAMRGRVYDNRNPRDFVAAGNDPYRRRAYAAHLNGFEVFTLFAAAVIVAELNGMGSHLLDALALVWVVLRGGYMWAYLSDRAGVRSTFFGLGLLVVLAIFSMPVWTPLVWSVPELQ